ncbi:nitrate- and nitrite sensing domain-containing protein [Kitasatospora sp. NPDC004240]
MTSIASSKARAPGRRGPHPGPASCPKESALRARANRRSPTPKDPRRRPRLSLRTALLALAVVPALALAALWTVTGGRDLLDLRTRSDQGRFAQQAEQPAEELRRRLQEERRLSAEALARPGAAATEALRRRRQSADEAVHAFQALTDGSGAEARAALADTRRALGRLTEQRTAVDRATADQQTVFAYYTELIALDLRLLAALRDTGDGATVPGAGILADARWAAEQLAREDALLARGWPAGRLAAADLQQVQQAIGAQQHLLDARVAPALPAGEAADWRRLLDSPAWQAKSAVEQALLRPAAPEPNGTVRLPAAQDQWRQALDQLDPALTRALTSRAEAVGAADDRAVRALLTRIAITAAVTLATLLTVLLTGWRLTRSLRLRILELHGRAEELERSLPELVERLERGEPVDTGDAATGGTARPRGDELDRLGRALDLARATALRTAARQAEQHRGFALLLQRIARRTQLLIGQQLRRLDELERKHEDPEVLEGLFDLDHLTARLRRYEENLVILAGGQPQRRWRKPVPLLDVLRAAQGEVQDYRRIMLDVEGHPWVTGPAVGPVAHVIAELMENAACFSRPPTPVDVRAAMVGRGLAVEIEDRGLGMDPEQYEAANELMRDPPGTDVLARVDDIRLGLAVVARLAADTGLKVDFRPSAFGGTRVVVLLPEELVIDGDAGLPGPAPAAPLPHAARRHRAPAPEGARPAGPEPVPEPPATPSRATAPPVTTTPSAAPAPPVASVASVSPVTPAPVYTEHTRYADHEPVEYLEPMEPGQPLRHDQAAPDAPVYPDIAYARVTHLDPPDDTPRVQARQQPRPGTDPGAAPWPAGPEHAGGQPVRHAARHAAGPGRPEPAVRRSGAAIGAFQRRSREARGLPTPDPHGPDPHGPDPLTPRTDDQP